MLVSFVNIEKKDEPGLDNVVRNAKILRKLSQCDKI